MLDAEVGEVDVLLVDDRRDPRVHLDHGLADELDVEEVVDAQLRHDPGCCLDERRVIEGLEVHREARAHRLARLRVRENDPSVAGEPVDRPLTTGRELHHEQLRAALVGKDVECLGQPHRHAPRPFLEQLLRAIDGGIKDAETARP